MDRPPAEDILPVQVRLGNLVSVIMLSKDIVDANPMIVDFTKLELLKQVKDYVAKMEVTDSALHWTIGEETTPKFSGYLEYNS